MLQVLESSEEDLARQILGRRVLLDQSVDDLAPALVEGHQTVERLKAQLGSLREDLEDARHRQGSVIARIRATRRPADAGMTGATSTDSVDPFGYIQQLEQRLELNPGEFERLRQRLELSDLAQDAAAEARSELGEDAVLGRLFAYLDVRRRVDAEVAALRATANDQERLSDQEQK